MERNMKRTRDDLIDDLNSILKDYFDFVPLDTTIKVADRLIEEGYLDDDFTLCEDCELYPPEGKLCPNMFFEKRGCWGGKRDKI